MISVGDSAPGDRAPSPAAEPIDPDLLAAAVTACASVAGLSGGVAGEVATYLPGRRVTGIRVRDEEVQVHVVGVYGFPVAQMGAEIRTAVGPLVRGLPVSVRIDDLAAPGDQPTAETERPR